MVDYSVVKVLAALGCGLVAGVFFAFSTFVMPALARLQPTQGINAMQSINIAVINLLFMGTFLGTALVCLLIAVLSLFQWPQFENIYLMIGSLLYLVGVFLITILFNVPLNEALAKVDPNHVDSVNVWNHYLTRWVLWNHIRTAAAIVASTIFTIASK